MNKEARDQFEEQEINESLSRYEAMLDSGATTYFDVFQIEHIIDFFLEESDPESAYNAVEMGLEIHPSSIALQICKSNILLHMGEYLLAGEMAKDLLKIENTNAELHLIKGSSLLMFDQEDEAIEAFNQAISLSPAELDETFFHIGYTFEQREQFEEALIYFNKAYDLNNDHEGTLYEIAYCLEKMGDDQKSILFYDKYLHIDPFSDSAWFNMGIVYNKLRMNDKAIESYEFALAVNDDFPNAHFNLGHSYLTDENFAKAIESYESYLKYEPDNDEVYCVLAECHQKLKHYDIALEYFEKAIHIEPTNSFAWYGCGMLHRKKKKNQDARKCLREATILESKNSEYWYQLALTCKSLKLIDEASDAFQNACDENAQVVEHWLSYAEMLHKAGMVIKAIDVLDDASIYLTDEPMFDYYLSAFYLEKEDEKKAIEHLKKGLCKDQDGFLVLFDIYPDAVYNEEIHKLINQYKNSDL